MNNREISERDLRHIWHPCTQMKDHEFLPLTPIKKGNGIYLEDFDGNSYIDAVSSWWVNLFGHANPIISSAVKTQAETLEHVILAGFTHEPVVRLSERLAAMTPEGLTRCFYADNGSSAIEVALKMAYHYYKNIGKERPLFISLTNSYHGETIGALSVGDVSLYKETYGPLLLQTIQTPVPADQSEAAALAAAAELETLLKARAEEVAALIVEPLIQGAGNMHMYHPRYLKEARKLCDQYDILLIADEIMTGFGRTGTMFACEQAGISPDLMTLSKGLTGGYLPLSVTMTTDKIYEAFYCDYNLYKAFLHSHSYTGNALACAAANATLDIFELDNVIEANRALSALMAEGLKRFENLPNVKSVRQTGMVGAVELEGYPPEERIGLKIFDFALTRGVLLRPLGPVVYFMPPYIINAEELTYVVDTAYEAVTSL
ncbi:adenosylmethionine--8-amino-7-oxononanoate transaminase [Sulfurimonas sp. HSL-3221]|uniref:adenosylmethionine--8-amino-7-oxononanoate transaminase n=1 Tax=Thiomicrolovo sulfuroxydans TaxID=2894755 RepID=UPI001E433494|nr:adenosylmethionine--8-amino-7-oxononanoate transaminase [Sulfurimonas sp. HSL-3221]UFS63434.1 adenosylmethionine--8-amino-7-oxononanoate transaminase [Sulfurimonas sp. HSL-3221]